MKTTHRNLNRVKLLRNLKPINHTPKIKTKLINLEFTHENLISGDNPYSNFNVFVKNKINGSFPYKKILSTECKDCSRLLNHRSSGYIYQAQVLVRYI